ncbi:antibiotic biosynthesis monooxygenase [Adhaeribacter arboris]|uniref:Antibiotic biosynthesis monooxygenase n=1 Tax=Adhaeribacter arboris TaxID=2072846 RepID=A0A2T2YE97_9BACT|nr:antibiotic biosynthesis monooxygenase family protein [Adhaeribacter arboris]PSR53836.1 antibiotic biosynthesis monooxygenase [Adhaeribacter arboris]
MISSKNPSVEIIRYAIPETQHSDFVNAYTAAGKLLQSSPYCLGFELIKGVDEPNNYILTICWTSIEEHLNGFRKSKAFGEFFNLVRPFYNNIQEMKHYEPTNLVWRKE